MFTQVSMQPSQFLSLQTTRLWAMQQNQSMLLILSLSQLGLMANRTNHLVFWPLVLRINFWMNYLVLRILLFHSTLNWVRFVISPSLVKTLRTQVFLHSMLARAIIQHLLKTMDQIKTLSKWNATPITSLNWIQSRLVHSIQVWILQLQSISNN